MRFVFLNIILDSICKTKGRKKGQELGGCSSGPDSNCRHGDGRGDEEQPVGPRVLLRGERRKHIQADSECEAHWMVKRHPLKH